MACTCSCNCVPFDVGVYLCNECIVLPFKPEQSGIYKLKAEWRSKVIYIEAAIDENEDWLKFPNEFNEDSTVIFTILQPNLTNFAYKIYDSEDVLKATYCQFKLSIKEVLVSTIEAQAQETICDENGAETTFCKTF